MKQLAAVVAAEELVDETADAVDQHVGRHRHAAFALADEVEVKPAREHVLGRLVQLYRVDLGAGMPFRDPAFERIDDPQYARRDPAVTAAVQITADTSAGVRRRDRRSDDVQHPHHVELAPPAVTDDQRQSQQKSAVEDQPALIDPDDPLRVAGEMLFPLQHHIEDPRADDAGDHSDQRQIRRLIRGEAGVLAVEREHEPADEKPHHRHETVAAYREVADLQKYRMHRPRSLKKFACRRVPVHPEP